MCSCWRLGLSLPQSPQHQREATGEFVGFDTRPQSSISSSSNRPEHCFYNLSNPIAAYCWHIISGVVAASSFGMAMALWWLFIQQLGLLWIDP